MEAAGSVTVRPAFDAMSAYWAALELALEQPWADDDLVYFGEDDYLYRPETFAGWPPRPRRSRTSPTSRPTRRSGTRCPTASRSTTGSSARSCAGSAPAEVDGVTWHRATSHTVSFAIRVGALREDRTIHRLALKASGAWDHTMCLACQGIVPYTPRELLEPLHAPTGAGRAGGRRSCSGASR